METSVDNTGNHLCHKIKFKNCEQIKNNFFLKKSICFLISGKVAFIIPQKLYCFGIFFAEADTKKSRYISELLSAKANFKCC